MIDLSISQTLTQALSVENCSGLPGIQGAVFTFLSVISLLIVGGAFTDHISLLSSPILPIFSPFLH